MRIGKLSQQTGVAPRMLRYYEEQGLITPPDDSRTGTGSTTTT